MSAPQYPGQYPPRRKHRVWPWIFLTVIVLMFGGCLAIVGTADHQASRTVATTSSPASAERPAPNSPATDIETTTTIPPTTIPPLTADPTISTGKTIVYEVISDGSLSSVTYYDALSAEKQDLDVAAPWTKTVVNTATYPIAGLGAQTNGTSVTCRITVDGVVLDEKTSTGQYAVVDCNASL